MQNEEKQTAARRGERLPLFGNLRVLTFAAMLTAMSVVLAYLAKLIFGTSFLRVTFENLPIIFCGISFGPVIGGAVAVAADLLSCLFAGQTPVPLITVGAASIGVAAGILGRYVIRRRGFGWVFIIELTAQTVGSVLLKSLALHVWFGISYAALAPRVAVYFGISILEAYVLYLLYRNKQIGRLLERLYQK